MRPVNPSILRAYDIRGILGETLFEENFYLIGRAFSTWLRGQLGTTHPTVCVGYDGRLSSPVLVEQLTAGLVAGGAVVYAVGRGPTPMVSIGVKVLRAHAGMMVTGSHNPPSHNGCKIMLYDRPFYGDDIIRLGQMCMEGRFTEGEGSVETKDIRETYLNSLLNGLAGSLSSLKIVWDAGNGATGEMLQALVKQLPGMHTVLNGTIDGTFPAHHPDPSVAENMSQLIQAVHKTSADLGIAFDGDGDRIGVVDHKGRIVEGDHLVALLADEVLYSHPGATIIVDIKTSQPVLDYIQAKGGKPLLWKSGHSFIKAKMMETGAKLAGEVSGHIFFADHFGFDDGLYAAVRLLGLLERTGKTLAHLCDALPKAVSTPEIRLEIEESKKFALVEAIKVRLVQGHISFLDIDGVRVQTQKGWWLLRASNTQAVLVIRCEAGNAVDLQQVIAECKQYLLEQGIVCAF